MRLPSPAASTIAVPGMSTAGLGLSASGPRNRLMLFPSTLLPVPKQADWHRNIAGPGQAPDARDCGPGSPIRADGMRGRRAFRRASNAGYIFRGSWGYVSDAREMVRWGKEGA